MSDHIHAIFRDGAFYPSEPCQLPEDTAVVVSLPGAASQLAPPGEPNSEERKRILARLTDRMQQRTLAATAPRLTRDEMHERR